MKKIVLISALMMVILVTADAHRHRPYHMTISFQTFYDELYPYGDWLYTPDYGYVWRPFFDRPDAFRPYSSNGDWVYTDMGWTWVSDYRWGWAPFHYGRWYFDDYLGWMWIPGYEWAPAWVSWGHYDNYWGWAPLGPQIYVDVNFHWRAPDIWWTFVPRLHFGSRHWRHYIYDRPVHVTHITNITNIYIDNSSRTTNHWFRGPEVREVERYSHNRVRKVQIENSDRPRNSRVSNDRVSMYRPQVERSNDSYKPREFKNAENARSSTRITQNNPRLSDPGTSRSRDERTQLKSTAPQGERRSTQPAPRTPGRVTDDNRKNMNERKSDVNQSRNASDNGNRQVRTTEQPKKQDTYTGSRPGTRSTPSGKSEARTKTPTENRSKETRSTEVKRNTGSEGNKAVKSTRSSGSKESKQGGETRKKSSENSRRK